MKNWDLDLAKAPGFDPSKTTQYYNMGSFSMVKSRELSLKSKTNFSSCLGITPLHLAIADTNLNFTLTIDETQNLQSDCQCKNLPAEFLQILYPELPITGKISFSTHLEGPLDKPHGALELSFHQVEIHEKVFVNHPSLNGLIQIKLEPSLLSLRGEFEGIGKNPVLAEGTLPLTFSFFPFTFSIEQDQPFSFHLDAQGELDPYLHLFYNDTSNFSGKTSLSLSFDGTLKQPHLYGSIDVYEGSYESFTTGAIYRNIRARLEGDGYQLVLKHFSANDSLNGSLTASGTIRWDHSYDFPFEIFLNPSQMALIHSDYATILASGSLKLSGNRHGGILRGRLNLDKTTIHLEEALPTQIKTVEFKYINVPDSDKSSSLAHSSQPTWPLQYDLQIQIPDHFYIQGKNLSSVWKGELAVTGNAEHPLLNGELRVSHGEFELKGKDFSLTQGNIHFAGPLDKKTTLYIVASKDIGRIRADIILKGPIKKPAISFRSNPPLSQREVLSYILFNRGISDITPDQGAQLSESFMTLSQTTEQSNDFLSRIRKNIGIDRLDLNSADSDNRDLSLQVGKYITENIFISINKSVNAAVNRVAIEAKLIKNVKAQAEVGDDAQGRVMLKWKKDY